MGNRSLKKYLYDVQQSIDSIYEYLGEKRDFLEYERNKQLRRAVERELEIIGEAVNHLLALSRKEPASVRRKSASFPANTTSIGRACWRMPAR